MGRVSSRAVWNLRSLVQMVSNKLLFVIDLMLDVRSRSAGGGTGTVGTVPAISSPVIEKAPSHA